MRTTAGIPNVIHKMNKITPHLTGIDKHKGIEKHGSIKKHEQGLSSHIGIGEKGCK